MIALCLQFYDADRDKAMRLARLIADLEDIPRDDVALIFAARFDSSHDDATVKHVRAKFPLVETFTTATRLVGWPQGPNGMARDLLLYFDRLGDAYDGVLMIEPDVVPLNPRWLNILIDEWNTAKEHGNVIMGAWRNSGNPCGHINGNMFMIPTLASWLRARGFEVKQIGNSIAWDCAVSAFCQHNWHHCGRIKNLFQSHSATLEAMYSPDVGDDPVAMLHGYKDDSAYNLAREVMKIK